MAKLSRPPPSSSRSRKTIFSSSSESEPESNNDSNSDSEFPDIAALSPSPKTKRKVLSPLPATKKRPTPPMDTASTSSNQTVIESATSPNAASSSVAGVKRRKLLLGAVPDNVLFRKWTPAQEEEEDGVPARKKKKRGLTANKGYGLGLGMMREREGSDSEAENMVVNRKKAKEVKRVGESTVTAKTVVRTTEKSLFSDQHLLKKSREGIDLVGAKNKEEKPSASLVQPLKQVASKSKDMMEIDQEQDMDIFEDLEDFAEESFHTAQSKESSESNGLESETMVEKALNTNKASNAKDDDSDEDLDAFFSKLSNKPKIPAVRESHLSPTKPRSTKNSRGKRMDTSWGSQSRTLFDDEESDGRQARAAKQAASSDEDTCGEEDVTQDFSCLQLESSSSSDPESSETETERRSRPPVATTTKKRTQTPSPPPKIPKLKPKASSATLPPSPPKKLPRIPTTPHRPSSDLFWSREFVDDWNDEHSPNKKEQLLLPSTKPTSEATSSTSSNSPKKKPAARAPPSPQKAAALLARESRLARQVFDTHKHSLATHFLALLDARLTSSRLSALTASTGGIKLVWSKTLNTTAGRANWKKESISTTRQGQGQGSKPDGSSKEEKKKKALVVVVKHHASIELATKVLSTPERLFNTLAHEFCHLAVFMIDGVTTRPHGAEFKAWAKKVNESEFGGGGGGGGGRHRSVGKISIRDGEDGSGGKAVVEWEGGYAVEVTTRHGYEIEFRYVWVCDGVPPGSSSPGQGEGKGGCGTEYKRHSKSIDPKRHRCGVCKGVLRQVKPAPRGQGQQHQQGVGHVSDMAGVDGAKTQKGMGMKEKGKMSEYQVFVKYQMKVVKAQKPGLAFGEVMKEVAERWKVEKARREKNKKKETPLAETTGKLSTVLEEVVADEDDDGEDSPDVFEDEPMVDVVDLTAED